MNVDHQRADADKSWIGSDAAIWSAQYAPVPGERPELSELRISLADAIAELQAVVAEFANYRRRADHDSAAISSAAAVAVFQALVPVLDPIQQARMDPEMPAVFATFADRFEQLLRRHGARQAIAGHQGEELAGPG